MEGLIMSDVDKLAYKWNALRSYAEFLQEKRKIVVEQLQELESAEFVLEQLEKTKKGQNVMIGLGSGNFVEGKFEDINKIFVSVGANVIIKKSLKDAIEINKIRIKNMENVLEKISEEIQDIVMKMKELEIQLQKLSEK
ncbi:MAG: prefoldin subunit alpha [Candidatus Aenigmatarchaeota archaeon]|nr:prefoldin subunit alpha [Candidatus Aenigmarchaeota archaeon]